MNTAQIHAHDELVAVSVTLEELPDTSRVPAYASDTWNSIRLMVDEQTGFVRDRVANMSSANPIVSNFTSPTNIGLFLASMVAAKNLSLITDPDLHIMVKKVLTTLTNLESYHGLFYNWYNTGDGSLGEGPSFISTVDNSWLIVGLLTLKSAFPQYAHQISQILDRMDFSFLYDRGQRLFYGGYNKDLNGFTDWHYALLNTEARIASYIGMGLYNIPTENYAEISGYSSLNVVPVYPSWGGSMFEVFMPAIFVGEYEHEGWKQIYKYHLQKHMEAGVENNGFWGFSPCDNPEGVYTEYGVTQLAVKPQGYGTGTVVTPYAVFLGLASGPEEALKNLSRLEISFPQCYEQGCGFVDSVNVKTGSVASTRLVLDQAMSFLSLFNYQTGNKLHSYVNLPVPAF